MNQQNKDEHKSEEVENLKPKRLGESGIKYVTRDDQSQDLDKIEFALHPEDLRASQAPAKNVAFDLQAQTDDNEEGNGRKMPSMYFIGNGPDFYQPRFSVWSESQMLKRWRVSCI